MTFLFVQERRKNKVMLILSSSPAEVTNLRIRIQANALSTCSNWISNFLIVMITPPAFANLQWRTYLMFCKSKEYHRIAISKRAFTANAELQASSTPQSSLASGSSFPSPRVAAWKSSTSSSPARTQTTRTPSKPLNTCHVFKAVSWSRSWLGTLTTPRMSKRGPRAVALRQQR